jgi:hypothetical protein
MRPLQGKRINRINLEPIKGNVALILQPFVFDTNPVKAIPILILSNKNLSRIIISNKGSIINITNR